MPLRAGLAALALLAAAGCGLFVDDDSALALTCDYDGYLDDRANRVCELVSDCAAVGEPDVVLVEGRCVARP